MEQSLGSRIAELRKSQSMTQEALAEQMGVSAQAVSKWENDLSCPDVLALPKLADLLQVSLDQLLRGKERGETWIVPEEQRKDFNQMFLRVVVDSQDGDKVRVNLPVALAKMALDIGLQMPQLAQYEALKQIDFASIIMMISNGAMGKLVEVDSGEGDHVEIFVE